MNSKPEESDADFKIDPATHIGHVHLKVADLERSIKFYSEILGFDITGHLGKEAAFLSAGQYHHHIGLNTWESAGGMAPPPGSTGLFHFAILMPDRKALAKVVARLFDNAWPIDGAADHGVSEAVYLTDPDGNGIEIYVDRPREQWPHDSEGNPIMYTKPFDLEALLTEVE